MKSRIGRALARAIKTIRPATPRDLPTVTSWIHSAEDCRLWAGTRVAYPIQLHELGELARAIELDDESRNAGAEAWRVLLVEEVVAFGQLIPKPGNRLHISRVIAAPEHRRAGLGRLLTSHLVERARERGASLISLNVIRDNAGAIALYRALGFVDAQRPADEPESDSLYMQIAE